MKQLYLIRHCASLGQSEDSPLTPAGMAQAELLTEFLMEKEIEMILCSPYQRARQSIESFSSHMKLDIHIDSRLAERVLCRDPISDWLERLQDTFTDFNLVYAGGESSREAMNRGIEAVSEALMSRFGKIAIVTHGNLMTLLLHYFDNHYGFEDWQNLTNPDVFLITQNGNESTVQRVWQG